MEARVFHVVRLCEPTSTGCSPMGYIFINIHFLIFLDGYNVL